MKIRQYICVTLIILIIILSISGFGYRYYNKNRIEQKVNIAREDNIERITQIKDNNVQIYKEGKWEEFEIRGIRLSSFFPSYQKNTSNVEKEKIIKWLEDIQELNANTILVPYIQPTGFYDAIYEFNLTHEKPIYMMHEIPIDLKTVDKTYDAFEEKFYKQVIGDIKDTIDVVHGAAFLINDSRHHTGLYLKDISKYNIGYVIGSDTTPEFISLTNMKNKDITQYDGKYYKTEDADAFNVFIAKVLDETLTYEIDRYKQKGILSYVTSAQTDPFEYENESKVSKQAHIDLNKIGVKDRENNTLFVSLVAYPDDPEYMDFEEENDSDNFYKEYMEKFTTYYKMPVIITDVGISSSRGKSKVNLSQGYNRGNLTEKEQGDMLIELLGIIKEANITGVVIDCFQDDWGRTSTSNLKEVIDKDTSIYWHDVQASDESFGLLSFESGICYVDGNTSEWDNIEPILQDENFTLKANADTTYLYLMIKSNNWKFNEDSLYLGIDTIEDSGSYKIEDNDIEFSIPADFAIKFDGVNDTSLIVQERNNIFNYLYKYHEYTLEKQDYIPNKDSSIFSSVYLLNRKKMYLKKTGTLAKSIYYNTGELKFGNSNPDASDFNSLADFYKLEDIAEVRIPWSMLNFENPIDGTILGDFYGEGIDSKRKINTISFSINSKKGEGRAISEKAEYKIPLLNKVEYKERLKQSYYILKDYWNK